MSFSIERYKEESKKLDTTGIDWQAVTAPALSVAPLGHACVHGSHPHRIPGVLEL